MVSHGFHHLIPRILSRVYGAIRTQLLIAGRAQSSQDLGAHEFLQPHWWLGHAGTWRAMDSQGVAGIKQNRKRAGYSWLHCIHINNHIYIYTYACIYIYIVYHCIRMMFAKNMIIDR